MSDLRFFMTHSDTEEFVSWLIEQFHPTFVLDAQPTRTLPSLVTFEEIRRCIADHPHSPRFYLLSDLWQSYPPAASETRHNNGTVRYYVDQRYGGPAFDFH